jgi:hypothetical protein
MHTLLDLLTTSEAGRVTLSPDKGLGHKYISSLKALW